MKIKGHGGIYAFDPSELIAIVDRARELRRQKSFLGWSEDDEPNEVNVELIVAALVDLGYMEIDDA